MTCVYRSTRVIFLIEFEDTQGCMNQDLISYLHILFGIYLKTKEISALVLTILCLIKEDLFITKVKEASFQMWVKEVSLGKY